jgi:hypothetical protein
VAFRNDYLEAKWSVNPTKNATVMLCQYCEGLTLDKLLVLAKKNEAELFYECEYFPRNASCSYSHHPSFKSLLRSSRYGCELCHAIWREFWHTGDLMDQIKVRSDLGLDTSVRICIAIKDKDFSAERDKQPFDRLLVRVGFDEDDGSDYDMVDETNERTNEGLGEYPPGCSSDRADEDGADY